MTDQKAKHRTIGVSFHPDLKQRADDRARGMGLSFSRYVTLCVEAELRGHIPNLLEPGDADEANRPAAPQPGAPSGLNLDEVRERGGAYVEAKTRAIDFENDIEEILEGHELAYERQAKVDRTRTTFLVEHIVTAADGLERVRKVALECHHNLRDRYEVVLGQTIHLNALPGIHAVVLVVPYLTTFDGVFRRIFEEQGIRVATPDTLRDTIEAVG